MLFRSVLIVSSALLLGFVSADRPAEAHGKKHNPMRYEFVMRHGMPGAYMGQTNPLKANGENLAQGAKLYVENCASCHGATGKGDGPDGKDLKPRPPALGSMMKMIVSMKHGPGMMKHGPGMMMQGSGMMKNGSQNEGEQRKMSMMTEGYLYWTISEGGRAMDTPMPGFKDFLSEKERWQVILFMSNDFKAE